MQADKRKEFTKALGEVVKELHKKSKRSARSVAYEIGISKTTLILASKGELDPQMSTFCKIAEAFYLQPHELLKLIYSKLPQNWCFIEENN